MSACHAPVAAADHEEDRRAQGREGRLRRLPLPNMPASTASCGRSTEDVRSRGRRPASRSTASTPPEATAASPATRARSFLTATTGCASCHLDVHKRRSATNCQTCHSTKVGVQGDRGQFDHTKAAFQLTGAHKTVTCANCHVNQHVQGRHVRHAAPAATAIRTGRRWAPPAPAATRHDTWRTRQFDHSADDVSPRSAATRRRTAPPATSSRR